MVRDDWVGARKVLAPCRPQREPQKPEKPPGKEAQVLEVGPACLEMVVIERMLVRTLKHLLWVCN